MGDRQWPHPLEETMFAPGPCGLCGRNPAAGFASVNDVWFCHGDLDPEPTCYMRAQRSGGPVAFCPDCHDLVFPGATICDSCSSPINVERTLDDSRT